MIAALVTVTFLATLWLLVVIGAAVLEQSGPKIAAALRGASFASPPPCMAAMRQRAHPRAVVALAAPAMRAAPRLRAAA